MAPRPIRLNGSAQRLSVYVSENEQYGGQPLYSALVEQARKAGCAGATVLRGIEGFGAASVSDPDRGLRMSSDMPVVVTVIDIESRITALAEVFSTMLGDGLISVENIDVMVYRGGNKA